MQLYTYILKVFVISEMSAISYGEHSSTESRNIFMYKYKYGLHLYKRVRDRSSPHAPQSATKIDITNATILPVNNDNYITHG